MNTKKMIKRIKSNKFGRILSRIVGEDTGAVMMEYVLVAMLIAAATVVAVSYFGKNTQGMFGLIGRAIWADDTKAGEMANKGRSDAAELAKDGMVKSEKYVNAQKAPKPTPGM